MTRHAPPPAPLPGADPGRQVAQLRELLRLVERIAGRADERSGDGPLDEAALLSEAYERALPVAQRRFDALQQETAAWAAAGVEALLSAAVAAPPRAAAARLADRIQATLSDLAKLVRR